jgi:putative ABC transport system ATP-binding protein
MNPAVSLHDLSYSYEDDPLSQVLSSVTLDVLPGELMMLTGASGSGKTTLLSLIGGLRTGATGEIRVLNTDLISAQPRDLLELRRRVGFIFQTHNLLPCLSALDNIRMGLELHEDWRHKGAPKIHSRCQEMLYLFGLESKANFMPKNLSLGQKQRISIARAIASNPGLILADEPTASLDKDSALATISTLNDLARQNHACVLVVTHDNKIMEYAHRTIHLVNGVISGSRC